MPWLAKSEIWLNFLGTWLTEFFKQLVPHQPHPNSSPPNTHAHTHILSRWLCKLNIKYLWNIPSAMSDKALGGAHGVNWFDLNVSEGRSKRISVHTVLLGQSFYVLHFHLVQLIRLWTYSIMCISDDVWMSEHLHTCVSLRPRFLHTHTLRCVPVSVSILASCSFHYGGDNSVKWRSYMV